MKFRTPATLCTRTASFTKKLTRIQLDRVYTCNIQFEANARNMAMRTRKA